MWQIFLHISHICDICDKYQVCFSKPELIISLILSCTLYNLTSCTISQKLISCHWTIRFFANESCHLNRSHFLNPDSLASHLILHLISSHGFNQSAMNSVTANSTPKPPSCIFHHLAPIAKSADKLLTDRFHAWVFEQLHLVNILAHTDFNLYDNPTPGHY